MNKVLLSEDRLQLILERHKGEIGRRDDWSNVITGVIFLLSTWSAHYDDLYGFSGRNIKTLILLLALMATVWGILMVLNNHNNKFDHDKLYQELKEANEIEHPFSIVAIKDTFEKYPNKYLLYYDNRWNCWFFFNFKTNELDEQNESNIKNGISSKLKIDTSAMKLEYKDEAIHYKYSESDKVKKYYHHKLYNCVIDDFRDELKKDKFTIDDVNYTWMTIDEMEKNPSIRQHNMDVVDFVKHNAI